jgi:ribosomal protein L37E
MKDKKQLTCKKCGGKSFEFSWKFKNKEEEINLYFCHEGYGFQFEDSIIKCSKCGKKKKYDEEDFLEVK